MQLSCGHMEVVPGQEYTDTCRTPSRITELPGRLAIPACDGLQRLGTPLEHFFGAGRQARTLLSQPIRFSHQCTAPAILQLEAGPFSHGSGRTIHPMERAQLLHVSPICTNPSLLGQAGRGGSNSSNDCPGMAEPNLVPSAAQDSDRPPHALTTGSEHCNRPRGPESPVGDGRTPPTGHLAHLRGYYRTAGLSERVISILRKSWRHSTKSSYANACRQWVCWCLEWGC